ncbi:MAG TPA: DctP family TRAP transporter solute-binding subunit [Firmicutes bacterium]|nr:DctP family TRAP transporter solute-binding subunit [Bacillota bacterium]
MVFMAITFLIAALVLTGCGSSDQNGGSGDTDTIVFKAGHSVAESHPYHLGLVKFADIVKEQTNGKVQIEIYANAQLGNERDMIEGLQLGTIDFVVSSTGPMSNFVPEIGIVDLPFLFRDREHAYAVLDGPIGQNLLEKFEAKQILGLAFWENGFRHLTNSKHPVNTPEDVKGLKIRTMENPVHQDAFHALGAAPTPMAWSEVFTALQQKTIDGQENPIPIIYNQKIYEAQKHLALTGHFYSPSLLLMSAASMDKLSDEEQDIIRKAAVEAADYEREQIKIQEDEQIDKLKAEGMEITEPDHAAFQEATQSVYEKFEDQFGKELIQQIIDTK